MRRFAQLIPLLAAAFVPAAGATNPPQVAFKQFPGARPAIVRLDQTGSGAVELTLGHPVPSEFGAFSWSPDGSRLVYASQGVPGGDVYSVDADGAGLTRLTFNGSNDDPAWSPDGTRIAFVHTVRVPIPPGLYRLDEDIWLVGPDGSNPHALMHDAGQKYEPRWSPDGTRILYARLSPQARYQTFVVAADTGQVLLRTADSGGEWSPDGSRIAVQSGTGIDIIGADGSGRRTVARKAGGPRWSPDGSRIAFFRTHCTRGIKGLCGSILKSAFVVDSDGQGERRLTGPISAGPGAETEGFPNDDTWEPVWWPDGSRLFATHEGQAWLMNADGTCEQRFGPENVYLAKPAWRPGTSPSVPALACTDLRVRVAPTQSTFARRGDAKFHVTVENDGNLTATDLKLTLRLVYGRGRIRLPADSCTGTSTIECSLPPLAAGSSTRFVVRIAHGRPRGVSLRAMVSAHENDSDPSTNSWVAYAPIFDCDIVGTNGPDRLAGTRGRDKICGLGGPDVIAGDAGNDTIQGGPGDDRIVPGPGRDVVSGNEGWDRIFARDGRRDAIDCGPGRDTVTTDRIDRVAPNCERVFR